MIVLGIETSCDDTSIALIDGSKSERPVVLAHRSFSQDAILKIWGGVVPEIAARNHLAKLVPLLQQTFEDASLEPANVDLIGVTTLPGLLGPLLTGLNTAKTLSLIHRVPIVGVNHLYAHLEAIHLTEDVSYPYLGLLVSGGHSLFALVTSQTEFKILGSTIDDAAGEAFDKGGKLLELGYPAGRIIDERAKDGDPKKFSFPVGLKSSGDARLSFSGVKTSLRLFCEKNDDLFGENRNEEKMNDVCASYQEAIVQALKLKAKYAFKKAAGLGFNHLSLVVGGGVACNSRLREVLGTNFRDVHFVDPEFCTDNGAMIANYALRTRFAATAFPESLELDARGRYVKRNGKGIEKVDAHV